MQAASERSETQEFRTRLETPCDIARQNADARDADLAEQQSLNPLLDRRYEAANCKMKGRGETFRVSPRPVGYE